MTTEIEAPVSQLSQQVRDGDSLELRMLAAQGLLPVPLPELVALMVFLAREDLAEVSPIAADSLRQLDPKAAAGVVAESSPEVVSYLARHHPHPSVREKALQQRAVPHQLLVELAPQLSSELQEILLLRQDAIVETPEILEALEQNKRLSSFARRRIAEYRQHLLPRAQQPDAEPASESDSAEVAETAAETLLEPEITAEWEDDGAGELSGEGLSEVQIRALNTAMRMQLSRGAPRNLRQILIRDSNQAVALSVLQNNAIGEGELEQIAANRSVLDEVLEYIGRNPKWMRKYKLVRALVCNPRTPVGMAVRLTARLGVRDLRAISRDRNVADAVRSAAARLYRIKTK